MVFRLNILGFKGGSGKSTIVYFLSRELSQRLRVLLIDKTYSGTISSLFGLEDSIFSRSPLNYKKTFDNLTVINATYISNFDESKFRKIYTNYASNYDIIIIDNPPFPSDPYLLNEINVYYSVFRQYQYNSLLVLSIEELSFASNLNYILKLEEYLKSIISNMLKIEISITFRPAVIRAIVINKYIDNIELPKWLDENFYNIPKITLPLLALPPIIKLIEYPTPYQIKSLAKYIEGLVYEKLI